MKLLFKIGMTLTLGVLGVWLLHYGWLDRRVYHKDYAYTREEALRMEAFPEAQYDYGKAAWARDDVAEARGYLKKAVAGNPLNVGAWLRLAEAENRAGHGPKAGEILRFTDKLAGRVLRWKWNQTLMALEVGQKSLFQRNINFLVSHGRKVADAFQLMDLYAGVGPRAATELLQPENWEPYLAWLMRWGRTADSLVVWQAMVQKDLVNSDLGVRYADFLLGKGRIPEAYRIWKGFGNRKGTAIDGFETPMTGRGFDWRYRRDGRERWKVEQVKSPKKEGDYALEVFFAGKENLNFSPLHRILPVEQGKKYRLLYWWKSERITTDQAPLVDVYGYRCKGLYAKGVMMSRTHDWKREVIPFQVPDGCEAVVVRLRRQKSWKFDNKIAGKLWLDGFGLTEEMTQ